MEAAPVAAIKTAVKISPKKAVIKDKSVIKAPVAAPAVDDAAT